MPTSSAAGTGLLRDHVVGHAQLVVDTDSRLLLGATFVGMQAFEWSKLISEGVRPWTNPWGAEQFGASFFMITGFHGLHVSAGVIMLLMVRTKTSTEPATIPGIASGTVT